MNRLHSPALEQKEDAKHGEIFFPVKKYITKLSRVIDWNIKRKYKRNDFIFSLLI